MDHSVIGVVMDYFRPNLIEGAGAYARSNGLRIDPRWSIRGDWMPSKPRWAGVLANFVEGKEALSRVEGLGVPIVHFNGWLGKRALPRVESDYRGCAAMAVEEFRKMGLSKVVGLDGTSHSIDRRSYRGLRVALRNAGMEYVRISRSKYSDALAEIGGIADELAEVEGECGLFMVNAGIAFSLIEELGKRQVRVPEDVAIIVIDKDAQRTLPLAPVPLTGVVIDEWQQGYEGAALVHRMIAGEEVGKVIKLVAPLGLERRESTRVTGSRDPLVAKALHLIRERPVENLGVDALARMAGVSRRSLEMKFRKETGKTIHEAVVRRRMSEAKRLLAVGDVSIAEVAERCRFSSVHYFSAAFKREVGETPGHYRRMQRERREEKR